MSNRGVDCLGATIDSDGTPNFAFICDCGVTTVIKLVDLGDNPLEFAYTCQCEEVHWITIQRGIENEIQ